MKKVIKLTESELKEYIAKIILEQKAGNGMGSLTPPVENYVALVKELIRQITAMKFTPKGDNRYIGTFNDDMIEVMFSDKSVTVTKKPIKPPKFVDQNGKEHGMGLLESPLILNYSKIDPTMFMKQLVGYINKGTQSKGDLSEQGGKRPHDKMVMDCLKKAGFKSIDTGGKYVVYMKKGDNLVTSQSDPTKFAVWGTNETHTEELVIGTSTNCQIIVATALGHLSGKR
jgi:hypothetical protein